jgi:uncharacterized protein
MRIDGDTRLDGLLKAYPFLPEFMARFSPKYGMIMNPVLRRTFGRVVRLERVAALGEVELGALLTALAAEIKARTGDDVETGLPAPPPAPSGRAERQEVLKGIIRGLHRGEDLGMLKARFRELVKDVSPAEISAMEQALIDEGMPEDEVKRLCDVHVQVFKESLEGRPSPESEPGHPLHTLMAENRALEELLAELRALAAERDPSRAAPPAEGMLEALTALAGKLAEVEKHYLKKENQLFPLLESKGVSGPSKVMWAIHEDIRGHLKELRGHLAAKDLDAAVRLGRWLATEMADMIYKEEKILLPMSLETLDAADWARVKRGEEEVGYAWVTPGTGWTPVPLPPEAASAARPYGASGPLALSTGALTLEEADLVLTHLPVDISFIDADDVLRYYSDGPDRIFVRTPAVIGRKVQNCHPGKSVVAVNAILEAFKAGTRDAAEFWIELGSRFIHIRYFAVRDKAGAYRGCLEVSQDVTAIRALTGQKRLLDWK